MAQPPVARKSWAESKSAKKIGSVTESCYDKYFTNLTTEDDFYSAVSQIVEEINTKQGFTQFRLPHKSKLIEAFYKHHGSSGEAKSLTKDEFKKMVQDVMVDTGFTGTGAKDVLLYMFGVPMTMVLLKRLSVAPIRAIPNGVFIPLATSATVFLLAKLKKI
uniref:Uncharacterized protein n=1 Tax=Kalanchoe fedtschenkoi TaxID=63787 RepID=A0A7N1A3Z9_KALFE